MATRPVAPGVNQDTSTGALTGGAPSGISVPVAPGVNIDPVTGATTSGYTSDTSYGSGVGKITTQEITEADGSKWRVTFKDGVEVGRVKLADGSSGGGGSSGPSASLRGLFEYYYGSVPSVISTADSQNWTEQDVINWCMANGGSGPGLAILRDAVLKAAMPYYDGDPTAVPASLVDSLISDGYWTSDGLAYLTNTYFPQMQGVDATNPLAADFVDLWVQYTGKAMGSTAMAKMQEIVQTYGYTDAAVATWEAWLKTTDSAYTGTWGAEHRATIAQTINSILGRGATEQELSITGPYWEKYQSEAAILEALRQTDEYQAIYGDKPAWMDEGDYIAAAQSYDWVMRWYYGVETVMNEDGSLTIPTGSYYQEPAAQQNAPVPTSNPLKESTPASSAPASTPVATDADGDVITKSLSEEQFRQDLIDLGFYVRMEEGGVGNWYIADKDYNQITYAQLEAKLNELAPNTYYKDDKGFHYVQQAVVAPAPAAAAQQATSSWNSEVGVTGTTGAATETASGFGNWGMSYVSPEMVSVLLANNISANNLMQQFQWTEQADYLAGVYEGMASETGMGAGVDWYKVASGAKGSGAMRAQITQMENAYAFKEAFHSYTGRNPSSADYDYLTKNFVSPNEYAKTMAAYESATAQLDTVNDLVSRVLGKSYSVEDMQNLILGKEGSGAMQAEITQAQKLDAYTWVYQQHYGHVPTPDEYAQLAGKTSVDQLVWEIQTKELINQYRPEIQQLWRDVFDTELTDTELQTLFGQQEGWGTLQAEWKYAQKEQQSQESERSARFTGARATTPLTTAEQGGTQLAIKPLGNL